MTWYQKVAMIVGTVVLLMLATAVLVVLMISVEELVSGNSVDRRCQALAEHADDSVAERLDGWGDCQVRFGNGFVVYGDDIHIP